MEEPSARARGGLNTLSRDFQRSWGDSEFSNTPKCVEETGQGVSNILLLSTAGPLRVHMDGQPPPPLSRPHLGTSPDVQARLRS